MKKEPTIILTEKQKQLKEKIIEQLNKADDYTARDLELILMNSQKHYFILKDELLKQYQKRKAKNNFDIVLFYQIAFNIINHFLTDDKFYQYYSYNKQNTTTANRYLTAKNICDYFITEYTEE